jgi:hypothetical protein
MKYEFYEIYFGVPRLRWFGVLRGMRCGDVVSPNGSALQDTAQTRRLSLYSVILIEHFAAIPGTKSTEY